MPFQSLLLRGNSFFVCHHKMGDVLKLEMELVMKKYSFTKIGYKNWKKISRISYIEILILKFSKHLFNNLILEIIVFLEFSKIRGFNQIFSKIEINSAS